MAKKTTKGRVYPPPKAEMKPHAIEDISFANNYIKCHCGWEGTPAEHDAHRKDAYAKSAA